MVLKMKIKPLVLVIFLFGLSESIVYSQADYSDPKDVAGKFLQECIEGKRIKGCELYGTDASRDQISFLLQEMVMHDMPLINESCTCKIDSCHVDITGNIAKCYYSKVCKNDKYNKKGFLTMIKTGNKWLVEYLWKRDKYL